MNQAQLEEEFNIARERMKAKEPERPVIVKYDAYKRIPLPFKPQYEEVA